MENSSDDHVSIVENVIEKSADPSQAVGEHSERSYQFDYNSKHISHCL